MTLKELKNEMGKYLLSHHFSKIKFSENVTHWEQKGRNEKRKADKYYVYLKDNTKIIVYVFDE